MDLFNDEVLNEIPSNPKVTPIVLPDADITLYEGYFSKQECEYLFHQLVTTINWKQDHIKLFGKSVLQPRLTAFYGDVNKSYAYSGISMKPNNWNEALLIIKSQIEEIIGEEFTSVLLNYYRTERDSMGWHSDDEKQLGNNPIIASVSFGETRTFQLRPINRKDLKKVDIKLTTGSILLMKGTTQHFWQHQIPKTTRILKPRINLTFRIIQ